MNTKALILDKLKEAFEHNGNILLKQEGTSVSVMAVGMAALPDDMTEDGSIKVRLVLRTTDKSGTNPYVDGTDVYVHVDQIKELIDFILQVRTSRWTILPFFMVAPSPPLLLSSAYTIIRVAILPVARRRSSD